MAVIGGDGEGGGGDVGPQARDRRIGGSFPLHNGRHVEHHPLLSTTACCERRTAAGAPARRPPDQEVGRGGLRLRVSADWTGFPRQRA